MTGSGQGSRPPPAEDDWYGLLDDVPAEEASPKLRAAGPEKKAEARTQLPTPLTGLSQRASPDLWDWESNPEPALTVRAPPGTAPVMTPPEPFDDREEFDLTALSEAVRASRALDSLKLDSLPPFAPPIPPRSRAPEPLSEVEEIDAFDFSDTGSWQFDPTASKPPMSMRPTPLVPSSASNILGGSGPGGVSAKFKATQAFHLSAPRAPPPEAPSPEAPSLEAPSPDPAMQGHKADLRERFELGDFAGALLVSEIVLQAEPEDPEALRVSETSRKRLNDVYAARLGNLQQVPRVMVPPAELRWLDLDHRAGFVLSLVDGELTLEEILDVSSMPSLEALRTLYTLSVQRVIELRPPRR